MNKKTPIIFVSTGSNYGAITNEICTEQTPLNPLSLYGEIKTRAEALIYNRGNSVCYRFATAYGVSPSMRDDLLVNDFVKKLKRVATVTTMGCCLGFSEK